LIREDAQFTHKLLNHLIVYFDYEGRKIDCIVADQPTFLTSFYYHDCEVRTVAMDEYTADAFVNRDDPIPVIVFDGHDNQHDLSDDADNGTPSASRSEGSVKEGKRHRLRKHLSRQNIKEKVSRAHEAGSSMQDRMLEK